jgi:type VI secretion system protein ImpH
MAQARRRADPGVIARLLEAPQRFEFAQAVRVLELLGAREAEQSTSDDGTSLGNSGGVGPGMNMPPSREMLRFRTQPSLGFAASEVVTLKREEQAEGDTIGSSTIQQRPRRGGQFARYEMTVAFMGLTGAAGVLPRHYTTMLIERVRGNDTAMRDWLDLFNHRVLSLFYRAGVKYRLPLAYEREATLGTTESDDMAGLFFSLVGSGTPALRHRLPFDDEVMLRYAGFFAHHPRNAMSLRLMVQDFLEVPAKVEQFQGQWLYLSQEDRSKMPGLGEPLGRNNQLGVSVVLGERVWDVQSRFRVRLGPMSYQKYCQFLPSGDALDAVLGLIRMYVGAEFDFDVQPVLAAGQVPALRLGGDAASGARLGWNAWVMSQRYEQDFAGALFSEESRQTFKDGLATAEAFATRV